MLQLVQRSANRFNEEPACSNDAQNNADATNSTRTAADRFRSTGVQLPKKMSHEKTTSEMPSRHHPKPSEIAVGLSAITPSAASTPSSASTPTPILTARIALLLSRRSRAGSPVDAGRSPAVPRCLLVMMY